jgi:hypothetical protein
MRNALRVQLLGQHLSLRQLSLHHLHLSHQLKSQREGKQERTAQNMMLLLTGRDGRDLMKLIQRVL